MSIAQGSGIPDSDWRAWVPDTFPSVADTDDLKVTGPQTPPGYVTDCAALPLHPQTETAGVWVVGAHGGAGETTLAGLADRWCATDHSWPSLPPELAAPACLLCARTSAAGLLAAQAALRQWAADGTGVDLLGLVLLADAPGRLPAPLRDLSRLVAGGAPRVWSIPWVESWRLGEAEVPREARRLIAAVNALTCTPSKESQ